MKFIIVEGSSPNVSERGCSNYYHLNINIFKAGPFDINNTLKIRILSQNQFTCFDLSRFSHSVCGSPTVKTYANKRTLLEEK